MKDEELPNLADTGSSASSSEIDRRPSWILLMAGVAALAVVVVSIATRSETSSSNSSSSTPDTTNQPVETHPSTSTTEAVPSAAPSTSIGADTPTGLPATTADAETDSAVESPSDANEIGETATGVPILQLPFDEELATSLPPGGIDGWLFTIDGLSQMVRTDLTAGEQLQFRLRDDSLSEFAFIASRNPIRRVDDKILWAGPDHLYVVDVETLEVITTELLHGPALILAHDETTVWFEKVGPLDASVIFSVDLATLDAGEPFEADPLNIGSIVAGSSDGVLRYYSTFDGSWQLQDGTHTRVTSSIVAGTNGGTVEVRCTDGPTDCETYIHDISNGTETSIDATIWPFETQLSPTLDAITTGNLVTLTDGTTVDLPAGARWTWSSDGHFLASGDLNIVDLAGEYEAFQLAMNGRTFTHQGAIVVLRSAG